MGDLVDVSGVSKVRRGFNLRRGFMGLTLRKGERKWKGIFRMLDMGGVDMSMTSWLEIYRSYTSQELSDEMVTLRASLKGGFVSQGSGSVQHAKDLTELRDRLQAATRVFNQRSGNNSGGMRVGKVDFSGTRTDDF